MKLKALPKLEVLHLSDVMWGDSPIVKLSNYRTLVLSHLESLKTLDDVPITEAVRNREVESATQRMVYYESQKRKLKSSYRKLRKQAQEQKQVNFH